MRGSKVTTLSPDTIDRMHSWCIARGRSRNTAKSYTSDLRQFLKAVGEDQISMEEYEELAMSWLNLTRDRVSPKTTGRRLTSLRAFAQWAGLGEVLDDYIAPTPGRAVPHPIPEGFDGITRMVEVAKNYQQAALVGLCGFAGLRVSEALKIHVNDIDMNDMLLSVRGKGDKSRVIPISDRAWGAVSSAYIMADQPDGRLVNYADRFARQIITNLGIRAGLSRPISSHDLRATFGTAVFNHSLNLRATQDLLGHSSSSTTEIYTGVTMDTMRSAINF